MKNLIRNSLILMAITFILLGCNTVRGLGQDIENAGATIEANAEQSD